MKLTIYLRNIKKYEELNTKKEVTASITIEFHLPFLKWKCLNKISAIIGIFKEFIKNRKLEKGKLTLYDDITKTIKSIAWEEKEGTIKRYYGKLENFKLIKPTSLQPTSKP